jgi:MFS family permease
VPDTDRASPLAFFFLTLPGGLRDGFALVTLPFVLTEAGFSVAAVGTIAAAAVLPNTSRFVFAPVVDVTLTLRRWYGLGLTITFATMLLLGVVPVRPNTAGLITMAVLLSGIGVAVLLTPVVPMTAHCVAEAEKGRAAGWYQAGNLAGIGLGGSAGVWLASHITFPTAAMIIGGGMLVCAVALPFVPDVAAPSLRANDPPTATRNLAGLQRADALCACAVRHRAVPDAD